MPIKNDIFTPELHLVAMVFELIASLAILFIAIKIFKRYRERETTATLYLAIALFSISAAAFFAFTGLASWLGSWVAADFAPTTSPEYYNYSLPIGYFFVIPYDIFLILFTIHIFLDKDNKKVIPFLICGIIIGVLLFLPTNYFGVDPEPSDPTSTRIIILGLFLLYNAIVYILLTYFAFRESKRTEQEIYRRGFQAIGIGFVANLLVFVFFLIDSILILFEPGSPGYSIFVDLAWICGFVAAFCFYIGYILPDWFRKRIEKK